MMGKILTANLSKRAAYLVSITAMFTMQNTAKEGVSLIFRATEGRGHFFGAAYASATNTTITDMILVLKSLCQ